jgi:hypothetical protein
MCTATSGTATACMRMRPNFRFLTGLAQWGHGASIIMARPLTCGLEPACRQPCATTENPDLAQDALG